MWRVQITLVVIAVILVVSLAIDVVILLRSGDESAGSSLGQIGIEQSADSLGTRIGVVEDQDKVRPRERGVREDEDEERRLREEEEEQGRD